MKSVLSDYLQTEPAIVLLTVSGSFADPWLIEALKELATASMDHVSLLLINLSKVKHFNAEVITALSDIRTEAQVIGGDMIIVSPTTEVHSLICMMGKSHQLIMHGSQEEAVKTLLNREAIIA